MYRFYAVPPFPPGYPKRFQSLKDIFIPDSERIFSFADGGRGTREGFGVLLNFHFAVVLIVVTVLTSFS